MGMSRKLLTWLTTGTMILSMLSVVGCDKNETVKENDTTVNIELAVDEETKYKEAGEEAVKALGADASTQEQNDARFDAIYNAIFNDKAKELIRGHKITNEEAQMELDKPYMAKLSKVYTIDNNQDLEGKPKYDEYYQYEGTDAIDIESIKAEYEGEVTVTEREATYEDNIEEAKRTIASRLIVQTISDMTNKIIEG